MNDTSTCGKCKENKPLSEFYKDRERKIGVTSWCKECTKQQNKNYYHANKEKAKQAQYKWREKNKERVKFHKAKSAYGITEEQHKNLAKVCTICGSRDNLRIDHNHKSGRIRGMLCDHCNKGLGFFRDDPTLLLRASDYILGLAKPDIFKETYELVGEVIE